MFFVLGYCLHGKAKIGWFGVYGISTFVECLMPNTFVYK